MEKQEFSAPYIGKNAFNVKSDLENLYPEKDIYLLTPNSIITCDYRTDRIRICHDEDFNVLDVRIG